MPFTSSVNSLCLYSIYCLGYIYLYIIYIIFIVLPLCTSTVDYKSTDKCVIKLQTLAQGVFQKWFMKFLRIIANILYIIYRTPFSRVTDKQVSRWDEAYKWSRHNIWCCFKLLNLEVIIKLKTRINLPESAKMSEVQNQHYNAKKHENTDQLSNTKSPEISQKTTKVHDKKWFY